MKIIKLHDVIGNVSSVGRPSVGVFEHKTRVINFTISKKIISNEPISLLRSEREFFPTGETGEYKTNIYRFFSAAPVSHA